MSTRSLIAIEQNKKTRFVTNHWDGYPAGVGKTLINYYNDLDKVVNLINHGCAEVINKDIENPRTPSTKLGFKTVEEHHAYYQTVKDRCEFEHRDWKNPLTIYELDSKEFFTRKLYHYDWEYFYLFKNNEWYLGYSGKKPIIIGLVKTLLTDIPNNIPAKLYKDAPYHFTF